jgi:hypothetical protein
VVWVCWRTRRWGLFQWVRLVRLSDPSSTARTTIRNGPTMRSERCAGLRQRQSSIERTVGLFEERKEDRRLGEGRKTRGHLSV